MKKKEENMKKIGRKKEEKRKKKGRMNPRIVESKMSAGAW